MNRLTGSTCPGRLFPRRGLLHPRYRAFTKKVENLETAVALHFMYNNLAQVHITLRTIPAMASGVADCVWTLEDVALN
jgi:hypothetical protein